jgi:hypothetical protein
MGQQRLQATTAAQGLATAVSLDSTASGVSTLGISGK